MTSHLYTDTGDQRVKRENSREEIEAKMALAFPAYHTELFSSGIAATELHRNVRECLVALSWTIEEEKDDGFVAVTDINLRSFGERVSINLLPDNFIQITSKCVLMTQCFDWGKNKENVTKFIAEFTRHV